MLSLGTVNTRLKLQNPTEALRDPYASAYKPAVLTAKLAEAGQAKKPQVIRRIFFSFALEQTGKKTDVLDQKIS